MAKREYEYDLEIGQTVRLKNAEWWHPNGVVLYHIIADHGITGYWVSFPYTQNSEVVGCTRNALTREELEPVGDELNA